MLLAYIFAPLALKPRYRVKFPGVAEIVDEHPPKRQQQAAAAKAPEITPFTS